MARKTVTFYAEVDFDAQEYWSVRIRVTGPAGEGELTTQVEATPDDLGKWGLLIYAFPFVLVAALWIFGNGVGCGTQARKASRPFSVSSYSVRGLVCPGSVREDR